MPASQSPSNRFLSPQVQASVHHLRIEVAPAPPSNSLSAFSIPGMARCLEAALTRRFGQHPARSGTRGETDDRRCCRSSQRWGAEWFTEARTLNTRNTRYI